VNREEIFQDVKRCMQENSFFQESSTQKLLLDILFIYSKLNEDIGYRQGMHELLAPILWVVHCDAIEPGTLVEPKADNAFMLSVLDQQFIEHDAFTLFCAVMQTAKSFYEIGESASPIVERSRRIHDEYLTEVDPELATHLQVIEILPQIFLLRWIRLLFGREFNLQDTLSVWDVLFAEGLSLSLVDMTCLAMLLRIRWRCMINRTFPIHT
jgi:TBC1 domain family member 5